MEKNCLTQEIINGKGENMYKMGNYEYKTRGKRGKCKGRYRHELIQKNPIKNQKIYV